MEQYPQNENAWLFWLCIALGILTLSIIVAYISVKRKVKVTLFKEPDTYIFRTDKGVIVKNSEKVPHQFTLVNARHYANYFKHYEIQKYGDVTWNSCSTYFKRYDGQVD